MPKVLIEKTCCHCGESKSLDNFHKDKKAPMGHTYSCKTCSNSRARDHHKKRSNNPTWVQSRRDKMNEKHREAKLKAIEYKGGVCQDCGGTFPPFVYDFHHLDGDTKSDNPSYILRQSWEKAKLELDKCVLLCANCHRGRHHSE